MNKGKFFSFLTSFWFIFILFIVFDCLFLLRTDFGNDNYNLAYPMRVLLSTSIQNGVFPFWDHWTFGGAPFLSVFFTVGLAPIPVFLSLFGIYSPTTFAVEMLLIHMIGFLGMYYWVRLVSEKGISLFAAVSFMLSQYMLVQFPINIEGAASPCFYPWYAYGLILALRGKLKGMSITALSLYFMFTSGYLGTNLIAIQVLSLFCVFYSYPSISKKGLLYAVFAVVAFVLSINLLLLETFTNQPLQYFTGREVEPFLASARGRSFVTFLFPNGVTPFAGDTYGGHFAMLYFGIISFIGMIYGLLTYKKNRTVKILIGFGILSYLLMLSSFNPLSKFLVNIVPFYNKIRFHSWNSITVVFFGVTLSAIGIQEYFNKNDHRNTIKALSVFSIFLLVSWLSLDEHSQYWQYVVLPVFIFILIDPIRIKKESKLIILLLLLFVDFSLTNGGLVKFQTNKVTDTVTSDFPAPENKRSADPSTQNRHYFSKVPHVTGYMPQIHPVIVEMQKKDAELSRLKTIFSTDNGNDEIKILSMNPRSIEAEIVSTTGKSVTWNSPYSKNWKLTVNGIDTSFKPDMDGLTSFIIPAGKNQIKFKYSPWYLGFSISVMVSVLLGLVLILWFNTVNRNRSFK